MKLITRQILADVAAHRWRVQYNHPPLGWRNTNHQRDTKGVYDQLCRGDVTPDYVDKVIGNSSWTVIECDNCAEEVSYAVQLRGVAYDEYGSTTLCLICLKSAYEIVRMQSQNG